VAALGKKKESLFLLSGKGILSPEKKKPFLRARERKGGAGGLEESEGKKEKKDYVYSLVGDLLARGKGGARPAKGTGGSSYPGNKSLPA